MTEVSTDNAPRPAGHYAQAIVWGGLVFVSGQLPIDPASEVGQRGSPAEQATQALRNLATILEAAGSDLEHVLRTTVYVSSIDLWPEVNAAYGAFFGSHRPARSVVPVGQLHHGYLVEIDAIACVGNFEKAPGDMTDQAYVGHAGAPALQSKLRAQCIVHKGSRILLVRHRHLGEEWWCLPGGGVLPGETPSEAALRELREECGLAGRIVRQTGNVVYSDVDGAHTFLVDVGYQEPVLGSDPELAAKEPILRDVRWMSLAEIPERDRCYLWAAGLLGVDEFLQEISQWGDDASYPEVRD